MAAGLPSVELYRENNLYDLPREGVLLAHQMPESIAEAVVHLLDNAEQRRQMSDLGVQFMRVRSAKAEASRFLSIIGEIESGSGTCRITPSNIPVKYSAAAIVAAACQNKYVEAHVMAQINAFACHETAANPLVQSGQTQSFGLVCELSPQNSYTDRRSRIVGLIKRFVRRLGV